MTFKVSVLRGTKNTPELVQVGTVMADRFVLSDGMERGLFKLNDYGIAFYNDEMGFFGGVKKSAMVAFYPGTDWVVEQG